MKNYFRRDLVELEEITLINQENSVNNEITMEYVESYIG